MSTVHRQRLEHDDAPRATAARRRFDIVDAVAAFTPQEALTVPIPEIARSPSQAQARSARELIEAMDEAGVQQCIIPARRYGAHWGIDYEVLAEYVGAYPDRLYATAGIDPGTRMNGVRAFAHAVETLGYVGAHTYSAWSGVPADDRTYYPYYAKAEELGVPFQIECYRNSHGPVSCTPSQIARIAHDFPELKIVAIHTGWPWIDDLVAVALGHQNVFIGCDIDPVRWTAALVEFMRGDGTVSRFAGQTYFGRVYRAPSERVIFGSNGTLTLSSALTRIGELGLPEDAERRLFAENARALYRLPRASVC